MGPAVPQHPLCNLKMSQKTVFQIDLIPSKPLNDVCTDLMWSLVWQILPETIFCAMWFGMGACRLSLLNHLLVAVYLRIVSRRVWGCLPSFCILVLKEKTLLRHQIFSHKFWTRFNFQPVHQTPQKLLNLFQHFFHWWHFLEGIFVTEGLNAKRKKWNKYNWK